MRLGGVAVTAVCGAKSLVCGSWRLRRAGPPSSLLGGGRPGRGNICLWLVTGYPGRDAAPAWEILHSSRTLKGGPSPVYRYHVPLSLGCKVLQI